MRTMLDMQWIQERYTHALIAEALPVLVCRRCGEWVGYLTMHARMRHGDDVEVMPSVHPGSLFAHVW